MTDLQNTELQQAQHIAHIESKQKELASRLEQVTPKISVAAAAMKQAEDLYVSKQQIAEAELEQLNRFVSFSRHIAPIIADKCVACHNSRTAKGGLNMDSFAALMKGGKSGYLFKGHSADSSRLWTMINKGSMPKDGEPLSKEETQLFADWIRFGTRLDAGVAATANLFDVMPEIPQPLPPKTYRVPIPITATAFNHNASILASSGYHEILLWNTNDGSLIRRITNVAERVYDLEFSKDGTQLIAAAGTPGQLGEIKVFSTADGKYQRTLLRAKDAMFAVTLSPDESSIATAGADGIIRVINAASGKSRLTIEDHTDWVMDINWSPDGQRLVSASRDKTSKVFDAADGHTIASFNDHEQAVYSAVFTADANSIVSAGSDRQARIWNAKDAQQVRSIGGFGSDIFRVVVTADGRLFTASGDRNAREHNLADGKSIRTFAGHKDWVYTLCYNPAKNLIATGSYDGEIRVWNSQDGSMETSFIAVPGANNDPAVAGADR